jgi:hypothetical protein
VNQIHPVWGNKNVRNTFEKKITIENAVLSYGEGAAEQVVVEIQLLNCVPTGLIAKSILQNKIMMNFCEL